MQIFRINDSKVLLDSPHNREHTEVDHRHTPKYNLHFKRGAVTVTEHEMDELYGVLLRLNK